MTNFIISVIDEPFERIVYKVTANGIWIASFTYLDDAFEYIKKRIQYGDTIKYPTI